MMIMVVVPNAILTAIVFHVSLQSYPCTSVRLIFILKLLLIMHISQTPIPQQYYPN